jgi:hypothetical protein
LPRRLAPAVSFVLLLGLFASLFWLPLRPAAWGGPRVKGPFEDDDQPAAGRFARDARLPIERLAAWRSPSRPVEATAEALLGFHALLAAGRLAVLWLILRRLGGCGRLAVLGVLAAALPTLCGGPRQDEWDVGLLLLVTLMAATTPTRPPWWVAVLGLPALFALWANAHASVTIGLGWLAAIALGRVVEWWRARRGGTTERPAVGRLLLALALCAAAACLNPDGPRVFPDSFRTIKNSNIYALPAWTPVDFSKPAGMAWGYFATLAALLVAQLVSRRVLGPTGLVVLLSFGFWPAIQQRGLGAWWLIVPWLAVPLVASMSWRRRGPDVGQVSNLSGQVTNLSHEASALADASGSGSLRRRLALIAVALAVLSTPALRALFLGPRDLDAVVTPDTPTHLAQELTATDDAGRFLTEFRQVVRATYPDGRYRGAILSGEEQGDFLAWVLDGDNTRPVMVYSRPETFDPAIWVEAQRALEGAGDWWEILGRHQVNLVAIHPGRHDKLAERLRRSKEWAIVEDGAALLVAVRREPKLPAELQH